MQDWFELFCERFNYVFCGKKNASARGKFLDWLIPLSIVWLFMAIVFYLFEIELLFDPYTMVGIFGIGAYPILL